ncbi:MAG TPA: hypothetical protein VG452_06470 [Egibacteraceae bacterium]|nr:hypothetical protein [Egibacteraceae bacterium]
MNKRLTVPAGKRALAAATLVAALVGSLFVTAAPAGAATGTIVFVSDHNVWIMPADDPSAARPVTTDGTADAPYVAPTADDRGAILAVRGGERGEIVRMDQNGTLLGAPFRPALTGNISDMDLAPDGVVFSYTHYESYSSPEGFVVAPTLDFAYADGSDSSAVANPNVRRPRRDLLQRHAGRAARRHRGVGGLQLPHGGDLHAGRRRQADLVPAVRHVRGL